MSLDLAKEILRLEADAILAVRARLGEGFLRALDILEHCRGRVVATGMGKSGIIARKIAATLASTGSPSLFLHPAEAIHGDLGMLARGDAVLALSHSGETHEILRLLEYMKRLETPLIAMTGVPESTLGQVADVCLDTATPQEACHLGLAPTASTTAALALGDALAVCLSARKGFEVEDFAALHPGGKLGKKLARISDLMRAGDRVPRVAAGANMKEAIYAMSAGRMGVTAVTGEGGRLLGVISDGDLRRMLEKRGGDILDLTAGECMTEEPKTVGAADLAGRALAMMERNKITSLFIVGEGGALTGAIHLHDLWGTELF